MQDFIECYFKEIISLFAITSSGLTAIIAIIINNKNFKKNLDFLHNKDSKDREDNFKKLEFDRLKYHQDRQKAYNRTLGEFLKLYHSYIKHKFYYNENGFPNFPDQYLPQVLNKIESFSSDILIFKNTVNREAELVPEITIYLYELLDLLSRFEMVNAQLLEVPEQDGLDAIKLVFKRAHMYSVQELLDEYFIDLIDKISEKAEISDEFKQEIKDFNSPETLQRSKEIQEQILSRFMESLSRQTGQNINFDDLMK